MSGKPAPKGVFAAVSTPLTPTFSPDIPRFLDHCEWLLKNGCDGLAPLGTTGEANSLGMAERLGLIQAVGNSRLPKERLIIGTGATSVSDALELSKAALGIGANGILMLPPFYYKTPSEDGLFRYFAEVAEGLSRHNPRIFLYHFPLMSTVPIPISLIQRLRSNFPGVFVGIKDSSGDFGTTLGYIREFPEFEVFAGAETFAARTIQEGGWGCISATVNVSAPIVAKRLSCRDFKEAERLDCMIESIRSEISALGNVSATKGALSVYRDDRDWARTAPPNLPLEAAEASRLSLRLDAIADLGKQFGNSAPDSQQTSETAD